MWAYFFGRGIVDPPDTFDPARLDPDNPPPAPWTLQPTNARLLNALAQHFIDSGYNLKALMREIANSDTYQLSSRYPGQWNAAWEPYFARKFVRRLWGEEIHRCGGAIERQHPCATQSPGVYGSGLHGERLDGPEHAAGRCTRCSSRTWSTWRARPTPSWTASCAAIATTSRASSDGSILQALNLMNSDADREHARTDRRDRQSSCCVRIARSSATPMLVNTLYLTILSRYPAPTENEHGAWRGLPTANGAARNRRSRTWSGRSINKVDFVFNY